MTLPSNVDEDIEAMFYALDDNGDFKVTINIFLANSGVFHQMLGVSSMS
jgi:hypothetical protein